MVGPGGGGTTIGPTISPHDLRLVVEHCDMTGGYITRDNGLSWRMFNLRGGIQVLAFDPVDPQIIYAGNAALWRSNDSGRTWKMLFPSPARNTGEHQLGDHSDYSLTSNDPAYPGGEISAIAIGSGTNPKDGKASPEHLYLSFEQTGQPTAIVSSVDGGTSWTRLATLPQHVLLLSDPYRIAPDGNSRELGSIPTGFRAASSARFGDSVWIYATGRDGEVYLSEDSGLHFRSITPRLQQSSGKFEAIATGERHPAAA